MAILATCTDSPVQPGDPQLGSPSFAISDGANGGNPGFLFLPPLVSNPNPTAPFNARLAPSVEVCELNVQQPVPSCAGAVASFGPEAVDVADAHYQLNWDTDGAETTPLDHAAYYRVSVAVSGFELGYLDVNPQDPNGSTPSQNEPGYVSFRLGENLPVKFWVGQSALCDPNDVLVTECAAATFADATGGTLTIGSQGDVLGVFVPAGGLPDGSPVVTVVVERIDNSELDLLGEECIPFLDAPQFGECFRIRTIPELTDALELPATISICADLSTFGLQDHAQEHLLQIFRYDDDGSGDVDVLGNTTSVVCGSVQASGLLPVPASGFFRYAALGANAVARVFGPQPLGAANLGLGGLTRSFSRFRWGLPTRFEVVAGDGQIEPAGATLPVNPTLLVTDAEGEPVSGARVHFSAPSPGGSRTPAVVTTGEGGSAEVSWTLDSDPGPHALEAWGRGILAPGQAFPEHTETVAVTRGTATFTATAVGAPAAIEAASGDGQTGTVGQALADPLSVLVTDVNGVPVEGAAVTWQGDGSVAGAATTGADGTAQATWTLGTAAGSQSASATVNELAASFSATALAGPAFALAASGDNQAARAGTPLAQPIAVTVYDQYGNVRAGDAVSWTVTGGGGSRTPPSGSTDAAGTSQAAWTLGPLPGGNTAQAAVGGLTRAFSATGTCFDGYGTATVDGVFDTAEWACAGRMAFNANVSGGSTPAEAYWMNDGQALYLAVRVRRSAMDNVNSLRFDFDNDGDGVVELNDDAIGYDAGTRAFLDQYLSSKCLNSSQSGCGTNDTTRNGAGSAANDGTWTTYELSHPLTGGGVQDLSRTGAQGLGFYLTLRIGNGAQGNTQVPGFRTYRQVTIVGP